MIFLILRVLHILGAAIIVGGLIYLRVVVSPQPATGTSDALFGNRRAKWAMTVGIASLFLLVSGLVNYISWNRTYELPGGYHALFGVKFLLGIAVMFFAAILAGRTALADRMRHSATTWLNVAIALSLAILIVGAVMRSYPRVPKPAGEAMRPAVVQYLLAGGR
jgi:putative copper export protein